MAMFANVNMIITSMSPSKSLSVTLDGQGNALSLQDLERYIDAKINALSVANEQPVVQHHR